jgi:mRNA interferase MazF
MRRGEIRYVSLAQRSRLGPVLTTLPLVRWTDVERALLIACGFTGSEEVPG